MSKNLLAVALFCLNVIPLNSFAASASNADIDSLVEGSRTEAREEVRAKIAENQRLVLEIDKVSKELEAIKTNIAEHNVYAKTDLFIASGTALATAITYYYFRSQTGRSEVSDELNIMFAVGSAFVGSTASLFMGGKAGYHYLVLKLDEKKIPALESLLTSLKAQLEKQTEELLK